MHLLQTVQYHQLAQAVGKSNLVGSVKTAFTASLSITLTSFLPSTGFNPVLIFSTFCIYFRLASATTTRLTFENSHQMLTQLLLNFFSRHTRYGSPVRLALVGLTAYRIHYTFFEPKI